MARRSYRARCRFYVGDQRVTHIDFREPQPGARYFLEPTCFHPFRDRWTYDPLGPNECGEMDGRRPRYRPPIAPPWMPGTDFEGTAEDFLGHSPVPAELQPDGTLPAALLPHCTHPAGIALGCVSEGDAGFVGLQVGTLGEGPDLFPTSVGLVLVAGSRNPGHYPAVAGIRLAAQMGLPAVSPEAMARLHDPFSGFESID